VSFIDCAGLGAILDLSREVGVTLRRPPSVVLRLLELTGTTAAVHLDPADSATLS
jgi:hypothetical protein